MSTQIDIYFADLSHTGTIVSANFFPLAIGYVAANLSAKFPGKLIIELFKYPKALSDALSKRVPRIMAFSNYSWNINLSYEYVKQIKQNSPETVIIMGGPNYGLSQDEIEDFWRRYPLIDFYIVFEGELAIVELYKALQAVDFDVDTLKKNQVSIGNCHYQLENSIVQGDTLPRIADLENLPSPYLAGYMDKFFDGILIPMISTTRGCPFKCTFCSEGHSHYNKVSKRFSLSEELLYIANRVGEMTDLCLTDANWGMFKEDMDKAKALADIQKKFSWPRKLIVSSGKNQKERVLQVASLLNGAMFAGGAMQSTDPGILKNIKRSNISLEELGSDDEGENNVNDVDSYTELILALPGDNVIAHTKSLRDMVEIGVNRVRMYQLIMLRQTEMNTLESRNLYGLKTKFRLMPRSFGNYEVFGHKFTAVEFEEICVANNTMSFDEYLDCRELDLTIELLNNGRLFHELSGLCKYFGFSWFDIVYAFHAKRREFSKEIVKLYDEFRSDSVTGLWETRDELEDSIKQQIDEYLANDEGTNEMAKSKAKGVFLLQKEIHDLLFLEIESKMRSLELFTKSFENYLEELKLYSLLRKTSMLDTAVIAEMSFRFNFFEMENKGFLVDPEEYELEKPVNYIFKHSEDQLGIISSYKVQYGDSLDGLGRILMRSQYPNLIRIAEPGDSSASLNPTKATGKLSSSFFDG